jgi:GntR family transcriptional regulator, transcriptional repressor for pyruvate dehydrogenase complex
MSEKAAPSLRIEQAPRRKLAETVAQQVLEAVRDLPPGTRLPSERELTQQLGVGRSTVREALQGLAMMGVIEIRHGQGVFVADRPAIAGDAERSLPPKEVTDELLEARRIVEVELARLAAERRTENDLAKMQSLLDTHREDLAAGRGPIMQASQFHLLVADAASRSSTKRPRATRSGSSSSTSGSATRSGRETPRPRAFGCSST